MYAESRFIQESFFGDGHLPEPEHVVLDTTPSKQVKVAKSNLLVEAHYDLSPLENKLMRLVMAQIRKDQQSLGEQVFQISQLCSILGIRNQNASRDLRRLSKNLMKKQLEIRDPDSSDWVLHQWVSRASVRQGEFSIKFDEALGQYLLGLASRFTQYQLECVLKMSSSYAIRLYELLKQVETFGSRTFSLDPRLTKAEPWGDFARLMGYSPKTYCRYSNIKQRIITPAIEQITRFTEFEDIDVLEKKHQRRTVAVTFKFRTKPVMEKLKDSSLFQTLQSFGVAENRIRELLTTFDSLRIERNIEYIRHVYPNKNKPEIAKLVVAAVECDYVNAEVGGSITGGASSTPKASSSAMEWKERSAQHPLIKDAASEQEFRKILQFEKENGCEFHSYGEFVAQYNRRLVN